MTSPGGRESFKVNIGELTEKLTQLVHEGNVRKVIVAHRDMLPTLKWRWQQTDEELFAAERASRKAAPTGVDKEVEVGATGGTADFTLEVPAK